MFRFLALVTIFLCIATINAADLNPKAISKDALDSARNAVSAAAANLDVAKRQRDLTKAGAWSYDIHNQERQYNALYKSFLSASALLSKFTLRAPEDGVVLAIAPTKGSFASAQGVFDPYTQGQTPIMVLATTLGRHTSDFLTSFYTWTPSAFMVEYGWGGRRIDPAAWQARERREGPSMWGHDRTWLGAEQQADARKLRLALAAQGYRRPVQVIEGNYQLAPGICPWWDSIKSQAVG